MGALTWAGYVEGTVMLRDEGGTVFSVPFDDVWREPALITRLSPEDAFRIGYECGFQRDKEMLLPVVRDLERRLREAESPAA